MKNKLKAALVAVAVIFGVVAVTSSAPVAAARPSVVATSATDCGQSAFLGTRVCVDRTTAFGPIALVYTSGTTVYASWPVQIAYVTPTAWTATPIEYQVGQVRDTAGNLYASLAAAILPGPAFPQIASGSYQNLMDYFANISDYEFVLVG